MGLARMANRYDDLTESMLNRVMCTGKCPCYRAVPDGSNSTWAYQKYLKLDEEYLNQFGRTHKTWKDLGDVEDPEYLPFVWNSDRSKSYESA